MRGYVVLSKFEALLTNLETTESCSASRKDFFTLARWTRDFFERGFVPPYSLVYACSAAQVREKLKGNTKGICHPEIKKEEEPFSGGGCKKYRDLNWEWWYVDTAGLKP